MNEPENNQFISVFLYPAQDYLMEKSGEIIKMIKITDIHRKAEYTLPINTSQIRIDISALPVGMYYLLAETSNSTITTKLIITL